ncbi:hypothetical protein AVEN_111618-1 [Araneus ventricosus]|uniref:Uncharacterized protein n=1 Tax=Araneus ventricosus TaxID=182803 RepID=A0A4Y2C5B0_ARAVE|nr:hypothetical protein AVEN_111618-1 [Araneus ventricosus]
MVAQREADAETTEDDEEGGQPLPPLPCIRRALKGEGIISSDYESSNESPVSSENNDLLSADDHLPKSLAVQTAVQDINRCHVCGGKTKHGLSVEGPARSPNLEDVTPTVQDTTELPLRHVFEYLDGETAGPRTYSETIGKVCENLPVANFKPVYCDLPVVTAKVLSKDQKYLLDISYAVLTGVCSSGLSRRDPVPNSHARWLTTANGILRLYIGTEESFSELIQLVRNIMRVYCIAWFSIKMNHSFTSGSKHLWNVIKNSRHLSDDLKRWWIL